MKRKRETTTTGHHPGILKKEGEELKIPSDKNPLDSTDLPSVTALLNGSVNKNGGSGGDGGCVKSELGSGSGDVNVKLEAGLPEKGKGNGNGNMKGKGKKTLGIRRSQMGWNPQPNTTSAKPGGGGGGWERGNGDRPVKRERTE